MEETAEIIPLFDKSGEKNILSESLLMHCLMENSTDTIYFKDINSRFILNSKAHARQFGVDDPCEMYGKSDADYFPENFAKASYQEEQEIMRTGKPVIGHVEMCILANGQLKWYSASKYPLYNEDGKIIGTWGTSREITDLKKAEQELAIANAELKRQSRIDELSGLYNRRYFYEMLTNTARKYSARRDLGFHDTFSLVTLDIDRFKTINDTLGHLAGDTAIRHMAGVLLKNLRSTDTIFRIGGDEFVIILPDTDYDGARIQAERIRRAAENSPILLNGITFVLTVSMGIACYEDHTDITEFVHDADMHLYHSKRLGRNRVT